MAKKHIPETSSSNGNSETTSIPKDVIYTNPNTGKEQASNPKLPTSKTPNPPAPKKNK